MTGTAIFLIYIIGLIICYVCVRKIQEWIGVNENDAEGRRVLTVLWPITLPTALIVAVLFFGVRILDWLYQKFHI